MALTPRQEREWRNRDSGRTRDPTPLAEGGEESRHLVVGKRREIKYLITKIRSQDKLPKGNTVGKDRVVLVTEEGGCQVITETKKGVDQIVCMSEVNLDQALATNEESTTPIDEYNISIIIVHCVS